MKRFALPALSIAGSIAFYLVLVFVASLSAATPTMPVAHASQTSAQPAQRTLDTFPMALTVATHTISSQVLKRNLPYLVYRPAASIADERFPVLYLLHGLSADCTQWQGIGVVREADKLIARGAIPPMVIVMPSGEDGYWMNHRPDGPRWRDYLITELIPTVEAQEPIQAMRELRAIGGISAGGHGALQLAWNNPQLFAIAGAHSPGLRTERDAFAFFGKGLDYERRDPVTLAKQVARLDLDIWIDTGDSDPWRARAETLHQTLDERGIKHIFRPQPGGHDGQYWAGRVGEYLTFYGTALARRQNAVASRAATLTDSAEAAFAAP
ncbi:MAG: alpha/beta hydrolase-fold protein [Dehalococcoidia bacterium]